MCSQEAQSRRVEAKVRLSLLAQEVEVCLRVPAGECSLVDVLPVVHGLADLLAADGVKAAQVNGRTVSCRKGCGACCRILVPLAPPEARYLYELVMGMDAPRRAKILARYQAAWRALDGAGVLGKLFDACSSGRECQSELAATYFRLGIECPFLEEEACSIYPDRPVVCRGVIVVSPAEHCERADQELIEQVKLAGRLSAALARMGDGQARWVPHIVAPAWALENPEEGPRRPGTEWIRELMARLVRERI